jgi:hypothetical protein
VVSAGLFLFGLQMSFGNSGRETDAWALTAGLAGYTLLLAAAALILVRFARVWDDVRTVLLLVVLMFIATSVTFDEFLVLNPAQGMIFNLGGLAFAIAVSEGLLRSIRLHFPVLFRLPYYFMLTLFFLYPVALVPVLRDPHAEILMWGLWGFSPVAGLVFLTLLPAVRRGPEYVRESPSPWPWPFYPWSVFVFLAFAVCGRSFLLCWSLHLLGGNNGQLIFGPYFLVPFGLSVAVITLELGIVARKRLTQWVALGLPLGLLALASTGHRDDAIYTEFLKHFATRLGGTPLFITFCAAAGFYLYAWARQVTLASECLTVVLAGFAFIDPHTLTVHDVTAPRPVPLVAAVLLQGWVALWRRDGWRLLAGGTAAGCWLGVLVWRSYSGWREVVPGLDYLILGVVLLPVAMLVSLAKGGVLARWVVGWGAGRTTERSTTPTE